MKTPPFPITADFPAIGAVSHTAAGAVRRFSPASVFLVFSLLWVFPSASFAQGISFAAPLSFPSGADSYSVALADFNGDGKLDAVVTDSNVSTISILLGNGDGTFQAPLTYPSYTAPRHAVVGDFNGDGKLDIAATAYHSTQNYVEVFLGNGDGTFQPKVGYPTCAPGPYGIATADLNGDGILDLVVTDGGTNTSGPETQVAVLLGKGDGTFGPAACYTAGEGVLSVAIGDLNGDGKPDLAVGNFWGGSISILLGNGDGTFQPSVRYSSGQHPMSVGMADVNRDGNLDVLVSDHGVDTLSVFLGNGDGTLQAPLIYPTGGQYNKKLGIADLTGDGILDVVVPSFLSSNVAVFVGNGDGTFQPPITLLAGQGPVDVSIADLNGDGTLDMVFSDITSGEISVLLNTRPQMSESLTLTVPPSPVQQGQAVTLSIQLTPAQAIGAPVTIYDGANFLGVVPAVTGAASFTTTLLSTGTHSLRAFYPGNQDAASAVSSTQLLVVDAAPSGTLVAAPTAPVGKNPMGVAVGDFNHDGRADLAVANYDTTAGSSDSVSVLLNTGNGTFAAAQNYQADAGTTAVAVGDFNGDGIQDLVAVSTSTQRLTVLKGNGDGTFTPGTRHFGAGEIPLRLAVADFNGDGIADVAVANKGSNNVSVLLGNGDLTFRGAISYPAGTSPFAVVVGDFNGDGIPDLAVSNAGSNNVTVLLGKGDGTFQPGVSFAVGTSPAFLAVADVNGDQIPDLVVANTGSNNVSVLIGKGDGTFQAADNYPAKGGPIGIAAADMDGDGKLDLVATSYGGNRVIVLHGNGDGTFTAAAAYDVGSGPLAVAAGDFNGDSRTDIVTTNPGGSSVSLLVGATGSTTTTLTSSPNPSKSGATVTFKAVVQGVQPDFAMPRGTVTFADGGTPLAGGKVSLSGGTATFSISTLSSGTHSITAVYSGDARFGGSTSAALKQVVQ